MVINILTQFKKDMLIPLKNKNRHLNVIRKTMKDIGIELNSCESVFVILT